MANTFGNLFKITTFGESHGSHIGCVIDGCPAGVHLTQDDVQYFLNRRRPNQSKYTTERNENDLCQIVSGVENNITLGTPIAILVKNNDKKTSDYNELNSIFRPGHADFTTFKKYGHMASSGGGRASARETIGRVAAAAVAKTYLVSQIPDLNVLAYVSQVQKIKAQISYENLTFEQIENSEIRCPDSDSELQMKELILNAKETGNSLGGVVECIAFGVPIGLGEPVFNKLDAQLAKAMLSLPASKSFEVGNGIDAIFLSGSQNNDAFYIDSQGFTATKTNRAGGVQGGISNGMPLLFKVAFKPTSTVFQRQNTITRDFKETEFMLTTGRHDPCILPRAVPIVEAMCWLVLVDLFLEQQARYPYFYKK